MVKKADHIGLEKAIEKQMLHILDTKKESIEEIKRYMKNFPYELDYNIYQYGNMLIYDMDIYNLFKKYHYKDYMLTTKKEPKLYVKQYQFKIRKIANKLTQNQ